MIFSKTSVSGTVEILAADEFTAIPITVDETSAAALAVFCQKTLGPGVHYLEADHPVRCLAEVSGAGGSYWQEAMALGADCLVTGEAAGSSFPFGLKLVEVLKGAAVAAQVKESVHYHG